MSTPRILTRDRAGCPDCGHTLPIAAPGASIACAGCASRFRVAARETVVHLDRVTPSPARRGRRRLRRVLRRHWRWIIGGLLVVVLVPPLLPLIGFITVVWLFNRYLAGQILGGQPAASVVARPAA